MKPEGAKIVSIQAASSLAAEERARLEAWAKTAEAAWARRPDEVPPTPLEKARANLAGFRFTVERLLAAGGLPDVPLVRGTIAQVIEAEALEDAAAIDELVKRLAMPLAELLLIDEPPPAAGAALRP